MAKVCNLKVASFHVYRRIMKGNKIFANSIQMIRFAYFVRFFLINYP